jgi:hypothetical protein
VETNVVGLPPGELKDSAEQEHVHKKPKLTLLESLSAIEGDVEMAE